MIARRQLASEHARAPAKQCLVLPGALRFVAAAAGTCSFELYMFATQRESPDHVQVHRGEGRIRGWDCRLTFVPWLFLKIVVGRKCACPQSHERLLVRARPVTAH